MSSNTRYEKITDLLNTSDIISLVGTFGVPETSIKYLNGFLIMPTLCHNDIISQASNKLYYYENSKKFMCYTCCGQMSVFDFIISTYKARGMKYTPTQAAMILEKIIDQRLDNGFAIITPPKLLPTKVDENEDWRSSMTEYNSAVLDCFSKNAKYLAIWEKEDISRESMEKFDIRYDMVRNRMVIPIKDDYNRLVGIKVRNFNKWEIDNQRKYMPLFHNNESYTYEKMKVAYGLNFNKSFIKKTKTVVIFEAEKSVLKFDSYFTMNKSIAVGGSSVSIYHIKMLQDLKVENIVLAFDNDYSKYPDENGNFDKYYGLKKAVKEANRLVGYGFNVEIIYDYKQEYLGNKDAPIDCGRQVYSKLYRDRCSFGELKEQFLESDEKAEEETHEIQIEDF